VRRAPVLVAIHVSEVHGHKCEIARIAGIDPVPILAIMAILPVLRL
jgi:hypothetical protein